ncbi:MAG: hypothetical protein Q8N14_03080, partial [Candidatus Omnitrophota bacterium]|nr:hypothetical protein [Candidatus Omnitrophota bacterium]
GQKYNLSDEKVRLLSKLVADVVLGITPITSLAQEINSKITSDAQVAMNLAQELYAELLAVPVPNLNGSSDTTGLSDGAAGAKSTPALGRPAPVDRYREPTVGPEVIDLRKAPTLPTLSPTSSEQQSRGSSIPQPNLSDLGGIGTTPPAPKPITPTPPLTFTRPIEPPKPALPTLSPISSEQQSRGSSISQPNPKDLGEIGTTTPLIEAEPHKIPAPVLRPQYIIRPSGLPPTDLPENVLDLRKDKGEF